MRVLFILADSLRPDFLGCYGANVATPTVDRLAAGGVRCATTRAAAPWTVPSVAAMLTGTWAHRLGLVKWEQPWPTTAPTLFRQFANAGFAVTSFVFDEAHLFSHCPEACVAGSSQDTEPLLQRLAARGGGDSFLFVHYWWTHLPYLAKRLSLDGWNRLCRDLLNPLAATDPEARARHRTRLVDLYAYAVHTFSEQWLPRVLDAAAADVVIITADHGESWGERLPSGQAPRDVFDLHGNHLHDEVLKVPWILHAPRLATRRCVNGQARTVDMFPTLLELLGLPLPASPLAGVSLADSAMRGGDLEPSRAFFARNHDFVDREELPTEPAAVYSEFGVCDGAVKVLLDTRGGEPRAFDLQADPGETVPRSVATLGAEGLAAALQAEAAQAIVGPHSPEDYRRLRQRLRSLAYL